MGRTFGSLFAGIGGFDLGFDRAGFRAAWQVEINPQCRRVLQVRFPDADLHRDVRTVGSDTLAPVDVICGGFPCQDLSIAGAGAGMVKGTRSGLFYEFMRIVNELRPAYLVWENVTGLLSNRGGRDMLAVLTELDRVGYSGAWTVVDAQHFGLAQRRKRAFGVFTRVGDGAGRCAEILSLRDRLSGNLAPRRQAREDVADTLEASLGRRRGVPGCGSRTGHLIAHTLTGEGHDASEDGTGRGTPLIVAFDPRQIASKTNRSRVEPGRPCPTLTGDPLAVSLTKSRKPGTSGGAPEIGVRRLTPVECLRLQGFPDGWLDIDPPLADGPKYRMAGNAVAVPCAHWIASKMGAESWA